MSLINCPDCRETVSSEAESCQRCGRPIARRQVELEAKTTTIPPWAVTMLIVSAGLLVLSALYAFQGHNNTNENVDLTVKQKANEKAPTLQDPMRSTGSQDRPVQIPETTSKPASVAVPPQTDSASVEINAKVTDTTGRARIVKGQKFYLLDEDLEQILSNSGVSPIDNLNLLESVGLASLASGKNREFYSKAIKAISGHAKYSAVSDSQGIVILNNVKPDRYFLFGIYEVGSGVAIWNAPLQLNLGKNTLDIGPTRMMTDLTKANR